MAGATRLVKRYAEALEHQHAGDEVDQDEGCPRDDLGQGVAMLGRLGADQRVFVFSVGVDAGGDPLARPGCESGQQGCAGDEQHDLQPVAAGPATDVAQGGNGDEHWWSTFPVQSRKRSLLPIRTQPDHAKRREGHVG